jgi:mono/diheme cytochrome c family protein
MKKVALLGLMAALGAGIALPLAAQQAGPAKKIELPTPTDDWTTVGYPDRKDLDPAAVERGRELYNNNNCAFCHGKDIRGGDGGPSLQRSAIVLTDKRGEKIGVVVKNGVPGTRMPAFELTDAEIGDIADFLHSFKVVNGGGLAQAPVSIVTGDAKAGQAYFQAKCASCHSVTGDLAGLARKTPDPRHLQQQWLAPKPTKPLHAVVTYPDGRKVEGKPTHLDEFVLRLDMADGSKRTIDRDGDTPKIEIKDPRAPHAAMLRRYADKDIHNVTAYLVTLK